ncbi:hypothetical protein ACOSP7_002260 [Xanthoceras sorbifolium]
MTVNIGIFKNKVDTSKEKINKRGVQCYECGGYGHISTECANNLKKNKKGWVTFGNGSKKKVIGKGSIKISGLPSLNDALLVDGLQANLISITHLCESVHAVELWHQRLGHLNFKDLKKLGKMKAVRGLPELGKKQEGVCGPCQIGKQTKGIHKKNKGTMSKRKKPNISYFHTFGSKCYILNDRDQLGKFDAKTQIYVDDIVFGSTNEKRVSDFVNVMTREF